MARVKKMMVWLIPVLWLGASIECDIASRVPHKVVGTALSADRCGNRESSSSLLACSFEQTARRLGRRLDIESGPEKLHPPVAGFEHSHLFSAQPSFSSARCQSVLELTQSWQFLWRTAVEPRAPSVLS
jgi:hypothetical protein